MVHTCGVSYILTYKCASHQREITEYQAFYLFCRAFTKVCQSAGVLHASRHRGVPFLLSRSVRNKILSVEILRQFSTTCRSIDLHVNDVKISLFGLWISDRSFYTLLKNFNQHYLDSYILLRHLKGSTPAMHDMHPCSNSQNIILAPTYPANLYICAADHRGLYKYCTKVTTEF